jgi:hypothetical protein
METGKKMTTREAFAQLINKRGWYVPLGIPEGTASTTAKRFKDGKVVSLDKMEEILEKAGAVVVQEKLWEVKI